MRSRTLMAASCAALLALGAATPLLAAGEYGTADEARAMLQRAGAAVKAGKSEALTKFSKGEDGFKDRDLYVFCAGPDGKFSAHPNPALVGQSLRDLKDKSGKPFGEEIVRTAEPGKTNEIGYMWPRPGATDPVQKSTYYSKFDDQICGVGYYK